MNLPTLKKIFELGGLSGKTPSMGDRPNYSKEDLKSLNLKNILSKHEAIEVEAPAPAGQNWSVSGPELAKKWDDPQYATALKTGGNPKVAALMKNVTAAIDPNWLVGLEDQDVQLFLKRFADHIEILRFRLQRQKSSEPETKGFGTPPEPTKS